MDLLGTLEIVRNAILILKCRGELTLLYNQACPECIPKVFICLVILSVCDQLAQLKQQEVESKRQLGVIS